MEFIAVDQLSAILRHLRAELKKTVLTGSRPRLFNYETGVALSGGYGLDLDSYSSIWPNHWTTGDHDEMCPVIEAGRYSDVESGDGVGTVSEVGISPFLPSEIKDEVDSVSNVILNGSGVIVVGLLGDAIGAQESQSTAGEDIVSSGVSITIKVPRDRGPSQAYLYSGVLARVLSNQNVFISTALVSGTNFLQFGLVPEVPVTSGISGQWLNFDLVVESERHYQPVSAIH